MTKLKLMTKGLLGASVISLFAAEAAFAAGTAAGTNVQNTFTLDYDVGGTAQPQIDTGVGGSNTPTEFTVDRLVDLTVASNGNANVAPGAQDQTLEFTLTNVGNDTQAYNFVLVNEAGDQFDTTGLNITYYAEDGNGLCEASDLTGTPNAYTPGSGAASIDVAADSILCVVVDGDIPAVQVDTDQSDVSLVADTLGPIAGPSAGVAVVADTGGNTLTGAAENVLADGTGTGNEIANEGDHSDTGSYIIESPDLTATKAVTIFTEDGSGCATIPGTPGGAPQYSIPGACIEYVITVDNNGATAAATAIAISDILPDELRFINAQQAGFTGASLSSPATNTLCDSAPGACTVSLTGGTLAAAGQGTVTIRALVQ